WSSTSTPLYHRETTVLVSRGIPGLGTSVSSTCLDFRPHHFGGVSSSSAAAAAAAAEASTAVRCATGLTSGALCVHSLYNLYGKYNNDDDGGGGGGGDDGDLPSSTVAHYAPRQQRPATSVAWRSQAGSNLVAIGLVGSGSGGGGTAMTGGWGWGLSPPAYRYAHNCGVESLAWLNEGQILAVGCQRRTVQLYDLRVSGANAPPLSMNAHTEMVSGIVPDCNATMTFATFGRNAGEPVRVWDARMNQSPLSEIALPQSSRRGVGIGAGVGGVAWSISRPGVLSIAFEDSIRNYDTRSPGSRALPVGVSYMRDEDGAYSDGDDDFKSVQCLAYQPQSFRDSSGQAAAEDYETKNPFEFYPHRMLLVTSRGQIQVIPESQVASLAISSRDGRIASVLGGTVWIGPTSEGPSAMEGVDQIRMEDISSRMMRRARSFHATKISTDALDNVRILEAERERILAEEHAQLIVRGLKRDAESLRSSSSSSSSKNFVKSLSNIDQLLRCWQWIALVENQNIDQQNHSEFNEVALPTDDVKGLVDAGVTKLLRMSNREVHDEGNNISTSMSDNNATSTTLFCDVFDSPLRRMALYACGWIGKYGQLQNLLDECEGRGDFERSAALAVWHGDLNSCVLALQRGAEDVRALAEEGRANAPHLSNKYSETLSLIAMCVAGFNVKPANDGTMRTTTLWSSACDNLLQRPDIISAKDYNSLQVQPPGVSYLRAILIFLQNIGNADYRKTIDDEGLSLSDRVGFACRFLPRADLYSFLDASIKRCIQLGNLEGLLITGLDRRGIALLQSYVDLYSDVQTAALISCRVVLPMEWASERKMCLEWLESYRLFLNGLQMWNSRASFDVGRFEHLRRLKVAQSRHSISFKKQQQKDISQANFPPNLWARCNYCSASLPLSKLRRQEGIANSWLSRQKPVLTCCPQCKKPLPRCSICLLSLGCLNPYMELQRERNQYPRSGTPMLGSGGGGSIQGMEDLSGLASIPFATWFAWCMRCKHGGHAHHLCAWFEKHATCAVSGCDCNCQLDGITKLTRPVYRGPHVT
ncbi:hypothetical protein ACHAXA_000707, partial [Cyclostephanos tholiformis]